MKLGAIQANLLPALDALLKERSVTRAATRLGLSQPAMSHSLARLREHFDDPLLVQRGRGMVLSDKAMRLLDSVAIATAALADVFDESLVFDPRALRPFVVGSADLFALRFVPELLRALRREAPGISLELRPLAARSTEEILSAGVELAFGTFEDVPLPINQQHLFRDPYCCILRGKHPQGRKRLTLEAYAKLSHIEVMPAPNARPGDRIDRALVARGLSRTVATRVPYFMLAAKLIAESDLVLTMTRGFALELTKRTPLRIVSCPVDIPPLSFSQIWHRKYDKDPAHRALRDLCARACARKARLSE